LGSSLGSDSLQAVPNTQSELELDGMNNNAIPLVDLSRTAPESSQKVSGKKRKEATTVYSDKSLIVPLQKQRKMTSDDDMMSVPSSVFAVKRSWDMNRDEIIPVVSEQNILDGEYQRSFKEAEIEYEEFKNGNKGRSYEIHYMNKKVEVDLTNLLRSAGKPINDHKKFKKLLCGARKVQPTLEFHAMIKFLQVKVNKDKKNLSFFDPYWQRIVGIWSDKSTAKHH
jgi:hypothetical protein